MGTLLGLFAAIAAGAIGAIVVVGRRGRHVEHDGSVRDASRAADADVARRATPAHGSQAVTQARTHLDTHGSH